MSGKRLEGLTERISEAVNIGGGAAAISRATGYQRSTINNWTSGQSEPSASALIRIAQVSGASLTWLATGEEPMRPGDRATLRQAITNLCEALEAHNQLLGALDLAPDQRAAVDNSRVTLLKPIAALAAVLREFARR